ncbi:HDL222Wp [Eremothecium sinecaudum]|uniref:37S ribosomal protein S25, mitochondrial n=1 Tax=Eremothecium sinecaudum TaxID=45286 RepID=A0A109UWY7_9SACH|nr:HDL222Wp [Eremothecium sinecaudum]AMD20522.1 HDL222Wp [Eremothecium sinecaudum]
MKIQTNAVNLLERTSSYFKAGLLKNIPAWYNVIAAVPPAKRFAREPKFVNPSNNSSKTKYEGLNEYADNYTGFFKTRPSASDKTVQSSALYKAPKMLYIEDKLRKIFYEQHPWELSRPKVLIENDIETDFDWSCIQQLGRPLDGESVVQRTLFLMKSDSSIKILDAYEQARFEFYSIRMRQELEEQIAQEEAQMYGSIFKSTAIDHGVEKEQKVIDKWKIKALEEVDILSAKRAHQSSPWASGEKAEELDLNHEESK